jgi:excisionase family DNA binding protein
LDKFLTVEEVSEVLRVSERMVREYLLNGELKGMKLRREWRIKESDLNEFINKNMNIKGSDE